VYSFQGLHAKVFVFDQAAVVGSTNVSKHSRDNLTEAALLTTDPDAVNSARDFVNALAVNPVDRKYLAK
jgi:phosphatidylserine/phosphatidylglycerophosphate/cardiolipin synthase-like enzyme